MNNITTVSLEGNPNLSDPFDIDFSYTQISLYDSTFKEASLLLEKAENIRYSFMNSLKSILNISECDNFIESLEAWIYCLSAHCQGRIIDSGLKFESQTPYMKISMEMNKNNCDCSVFFENLRLFLRVSFEARANLTEINQNLHILGKKTEKFFNSIKMEAEKLELNSISTSIIRRNITQNIQKISASFQKINTLDIMFKNLELDKQHFFQICNGFIQSADEIGLRGWYEKRMSPKQYKELLNPINIEKTCENDQETNISEKGEKELVCDKNEETKGFFYMQGDFDELESNSAACWNTGIDLPSESINNDKAEKSDKEKFFEKLGKFDKIYEKSDTSLKVQQQEKILVQSEKSEKLDKIEKNRGITEFGVFPMIIPFNSLMLIQNINPKANINVCEALFLQRRVMLKFMPNLQESHIFLLLSELNTMTSLNSHNIVNYIGFTFIKEPFSFYMVYECFPYNLNEILIKKKKEFTYNEKIDISLEILKALECFNKLELFHGNLTSRNILMDFNYKPHLVDYIMNKVIKKNANKYDSIENINKNNDIYSFGVIYYELFSEKEAWQGLTNEETVKEKKKLNFFNRNARLSKEIDDIVEKCVNCEDEERPKAVELMAMLNKIRKN